jgi:hypothetical protein
MNELESTEASVTGKSWIWSTNGLTGGQLQINIETPAGIFSWWPLSRGQILFHKKIPGTTGKNTLRWEGVTPNRLINSIEKRLKELNHV